MQQMRYTIDKNLPVIREADVIVVGGGPGGIGAAVMAARAGARTLLIERYGFLGGMAASGEVHPFMPSHYKGESLDRPVYTDWVARIHSYLSDETRARIEADPKFNVSLKLGISKDVAMLAAEDLCLEAGVELLYHHWLADAIIRDRRIEALALLSKSGLSAVRAKVFVDCTGDADLAAMTGCECDIGNAEGLCQPMTTCFKLSHVNREAFQKAGGRKRMNELYQQARASGEVNCPREDVLTFNFYDDDVIHFNTTRIIRKLGTNGEQLSEAEIEGRRQVREYLRWLRRRVPGFEQAQLHSMAHHVGVRETRRVRGIALLTREAFDGRARYPDAIARCNYGIDIHNPGGGGTERAHLEKDEFYEIPYGCVVARDVDNLTVGGRPISVDHAIHSSMRVMAPACSVGQAAGMAAAMAAARGCAPKDLDGVEVRKALIAQGAFLEEL
mgnify:CR=1 FL=1